MLKTFGLIMFVLGIGICLGICLNNLQIGHTVFAQQKVSSPKQEKILVRGSGRAVTGKKLKEVEKFKFRALNNPQFQFFEDVPKGKKLVITDVIYVSQRSVYQKAIFINFNGGDGLLFQVFVSPDTAGELHLCSGYEMSSGRSLMTYTDGTSGPEQYVSISVTGYLVDE